MQMGTPVIVTDVGHGKTCRKHKVGMVVRPGNCEDLKNAIIRFPKGCEKKIQGEYQKIQQQFQRQKKRQPLPGKRSAENINLGYDGPP